MRSTAVSPPRWPKEWTPSPPSALALPPPPSPSRAPAPPPRCHHAPRSTRSCPRGSAACRDPAPYSLCVEQLLYRCRQTWWLAHGQQIMGASCHSMQPQGGHLVDEGVHAAASSFEH